MIGTRYYGSGSKTIAMRSAGRLTFLLSDHHGTASVQVDDTTGQDVTRRRTTLFGAPRGTQPEGWAGDKGFVGGTRDSGTGLTHLGAREYDPVVGRFISVDPVMDLNDPQQANGYTYASNNPATSSDPTGLIPGGCGTEGPCYGYSPSHGCPGGCGSTANVEWGESRVSNPHWSPRSRGSDSSYHGAYRAGFGSKPTGSQRAVFNVGRGPDRGIIMMRFFIHTRMAMLGQLLGDNRGFSVDPEEDSRMVLFWDTATGQVSYTIAPSHTPPGDDAYMMARFGRHADPSRMIPANKILINSRSSDTMGGNNVLNPRESSPDGIRMDVHAVQSLFPLFSVDNTVSIKTNKSSVSVSRSGDPYPDMEVVQYPRNGEPRVVATDNMANENGLDSMPLRVPGINSSKIDRSWTDGRCVRGCR
ncbi:RHS repeat-associated core domain-containing protein [Streptomyces sp. ISL-11]|uniref:RHS repeat domain-containing protein n=1 Tax=Streptomyces sp. ISL-11 TaxID=2819174 RepID=UPI0027E56B1B|nr:RHS repeat-associated core domain-containing protein [Streptomyces sp. ISL-11]